MVAVAIGVTVSELALATQVVWPSGVIAMIAGPPTVIGVPTVLVVVAIGVTVPEMALAT